MTGLLSEKALIMRVRINSEVETREALLRAGMDSDIIHINDLIAAGRGSPRTGSSSSRAVSPTGRTRCRERVRKTG
jgi:hypothetical protein